MVEATLFISLIILAIVQLIKMLAPSVQGWATILIAFAVGIVIAVVDTTIGVQDITIAQGIVASLGAIGIASTAQKAAGNA